MTSRAHQEATEAWLLRCLYLSQCAVGALERGDAREAKNLVVTLRNLRRRPPTVADAERYVEIKRTSSSG